MNSSSADGRPRFSLRDGGELCAPRWPERRIVPSLRLLGSSRSRVLTRRSTLSVRTRRIGLISTLNAKLAEALGRVVKGATSRRVAIASEKAALEGTLLTGRQILFMVYQEYRRDDSKTDHVAHANLEKLGSVTVDSRHSS